MQNYLLERYKTLIRNSYFSKAENIGKQYAFIGTGVHARAQLYPVLQHLGVPLKYIYSKKVANSKRMAAIYKNSSGIAELKTILDDKNIAGVFVSVSAVEHFKICRQLLEADKDVFVEKPPCESLNELNTLLSVATTSLLHVNFQQRYSPAIIILKKRAEHTRFYRIEYLTGLVSADKELEELFIHPLDLAIHLFGDVTAVHFRQIQANGGITFLVHLDHAGGAKGELKLSTSYSWLQASEKIEMHCGDAVYTCNFPFVVRRTALPKNILGFSVEKLLKTPVMEETLLSGDNIATVAENHLSNLYGFYNSIETFVSKVEKAEKTSKADMDQLRGLFKLIEQLRE